jgi:hypothetical protein
VAEKFLIKQGDLLPRLDFTLLDGTTPVDLSTALSGRFIMSNRVGTKVDRAVAFLPQNLPENHGRGYFAWQDVDTDTVGSFNGEIEVVWPGDKTQTFPAKGYITVLVLKDLDPEVVTP